MGGTNTVSASSAQLPATISASSKTIPQHLQQPSYGSATYPGGGLACGLISPRLGAQQPPQTPPPSIRFTPVGSNVPSIFGPVPSLLQSLAPPSPRVTYYDVSNSTSTQNGIASGAPSHAAQAVPLAANVNAHWQANPTLPSTPGFPRSTADQLKSGLFHFKPPPKQEDKSGDGNSPPRVALPGWENAPSKDMFTL